MTKPLRLPPLHPVRAEALAKACERNDHEPELRTLAQDLKQLLKPTTKARRPSKLPKVPRPAPASGTWGTRALRWAVWQRSEGRCECGCKRRISWAGSFKFNMDHFLGRGQGRPSQSPENTWALSGDCDVAKTTNKPSRKHWLRVFLLHLEQHGFGSSETAKGIRDELAAEELLAEAARASARAVTAAEDLAERAKGAVDAGR